MTGIGLIAGQKWARFLTILGLVSGFIVWFTSVFLPSFQNSRERVSITAFTIALATIVLCIILLLFNKKVADEFGDTIPKDEYDDTIDQDLML